MIQAKFSLAKEQIQFLKQHKSYGFKDKSTLVRAALNRLRQELEQKTLEDSAELYAQLYQDDDELQQLTEAALEDWPE